MYKDKTFEEIMDALRKAQATKVDVISEPKINPPEQATLNSFWNVEYFFPDLIIATAQIEDELDEKQAEISIMIDEVSFKSWLTIKFMDGLSSKRHWFPDLLLSVYSPSIGSINKLPLKKDSKEQNKFLLVDQSLESSLLQYFTNKEPVWIEVWLDSLLPSRLKKLFQFKLESIPRELLIPYGTSLKDTENNRINLYKKVIKLLEDEG